MQWHELKRWIAWMVPGLMSMNLWSAEFPVFDGMHHAGKPDLAAFGLRPARLVYDSWIFAEGSRPDSSPRIDYVRRVAARFCKPEAVVILDIERWLDVPHSTARFVNFASEFRGYCPGATLGYYSVVPVNDYWRAIGNRGEPGRAQWRAENDAYAPVVASIDVLFPSLYTFYDDEKGWVKYAEENIREARRISGGKPVYVFLWPGFHESNEALRGKTLRAAFWRTELETARRLADGIVIWGGGRWDPTAEWWVETQKFLDALKKK